MSVNRSNLLWICSLVVASLTTGQMIYGADPDSNLPTDEKVVPTKASPTGSLKVKDPDPYKNLHVPPPTDKYDPTKYSLNQQSSMANKSFSAQTIAISKNGTSFVNPQENYNSAKSYNQLNAANLRTGSGKFVTSTSSDATHTDAQFNRNYGTSNSAMASNRATDLTSASPDQNRTSALSGQKSDVYSANLSKQYLGPGAQHVPDGMVKENVVINHVSEIPNRPLTIDEVRGLINHGFKPDLTATPDAPTKAINDPNYRPEASPEPPDVLTPRGPSMPEEKGDLLPSPGAMSQPPPENNDPLPQH